MFCFMRLDATLQHYQPVHRAFEHSAVAENFFYHLLDSVLVHDVNCVTHENSFDVPNQETLTRCTVFHNPNYFC